MNFYEDAEIQFVLDVIALYFQIYAITYVIGFIIFTLKQLKPIGLNINYGFFSIFPLPYYVNDE